MIRVPCDLIYVSKGTLADVLLFRKWKNKPVIEKFVYCAAAKRRCCQFPLFLVKTLGKSKQELLFQNIDTERKSSVVKLASFDEFRDMITLVGQDQKAKILTPSVKISSTVSSK